MVNTCLCPCGWDNFHLGKVSQPSPWDSGWDTLNKSQSYFKTYPHGGFKRSCQDVINWKLRVIAPGLTKKQKTQAQWKLVLTLPKLSYSASILLTHQWSPLKNIHPHRAASLLTWVGLVPLVGGTKNPSSAPPAAGGISYGKNSEWVTF